MSLNSLTIKSSPSKFFFTGDIYLNPNKSVSLDILKLTKTQLLDIIEAESMKELIVSNIDSVKIQYKKLSGDCSTGDVDLTSRVGKVETTLENLTVGEVASVTYWSSTEW